MVVAEELLSYFSLLISLTTLTDLILIPTLHFSGSIPEEKSMLPPHSEVATDSAAEHSYDEDDAHILSPLLDDASSVRVVQAAKINGSSSNSRPNSGVRREGTSPLEMRQMAAGPNKSKAITIGNGRATYSSSPSASLLMGERNGSAEGERRRRRQRKMTLGSSESSSNASSRASSDNEGHGDAFDANIRFS